MQNDKQAGVLTGSRNSEKRVLIACPTLALNPNPNQWLQSFLSIINGVRRERMTHATLFPYRKNWWDANNMIWDAAFENKFDYILRMDDDVHEVPDEAFSKLLEADKDVIGAAYPSQHFPYFTCAVRKTTNHSFIDLHKKNIEALEEAKPEKDGSQIVKVDLVGFGMTLIKVEPFKYLERPIYKGVEECPDDSYFAQICADNGVEQYVHFGVRIAHRHVNFRNNRHLFQAEYVPEKESEKELENANTER